MRGRPNKEGLDYFSFDVDFFEDDKIRLIEAEFGLKGSYVAIRLLSKIYGTNGYYYKWGADECLLLAGAIGVSKELVAEIVSGLVKRSFFDERVLLTFGVLTSRSIQKRYILATERRKSIFLAREYLLLDSLDLINVNINLFNVNINSENENIKHIKESKVNKTPPYSKSLFNVNINSENENINSGFEEKEKSCGKKEKEFVPPSFEEILEVVELQLKKQSSYDKEAAETIASKFINYWSDADWLTQSGLKLVQWRSRVQNDTIDFSRKKLKQNANTNTKRTFTKTPTAGRGGKIVEQPGAFTTAELDEQQTTFHRAGVKTFAG